MLHTRAHSQVSPNLRVTYLVLNPYSAAKIWFQLDASMIKSELPLGWQRWTGLSVESGLCLRAAQYIGVHMDRMMHLEDLGSPALAGVRGNGSSYRVAIRNPLCARRRFAYI